MMRMLGEIVVMVMVYVAVLAAAALYLEFFILRKR
jgi:hypothetical protein